ncbi:putative phage abortive infection protein [Capnocytophaga canimorsus]|uniref:putative phage abortive infection protein n=1 Tax=Capnocytophaga canimorsus TaxID=28188 RepID=UPI001EDD2AF2|nr:putative phage abortive infection protein [Capnocytophaga canimorsus]GJQ03930.1 hypothetical protein CAPN009_03450 [Capnocytophaga canimorsus]
MTWIKKYITINTILIVLSIICIVFSIFSPFIFTRSNECGIDFSKTGEIGDTIGGLTSPFIGVAAVFVTGLAFYIQYKANEEVKKQFEFQKFESQFYEMLRLHKENVNEIEIETIDGKTIKGRNAFFEMKKDLENLLILSDEDNNSFKMNYNIFFWGFKEDRKPIRYTNVTDEESEAFLVEFIKSMEKKEEPTNLAKYMHDGEIELSDGSGKVSKLRIRKLEGHHSYLGHYYRHLFLTVKFVVNQKEDLISEEEKLNYLRILRAQLSNYEQIMLFYNWLSGYGGDWESNENQFFTKYKMIHNLWHREMYKDDFIKGKLKKLIDKYKKNGGSGDFFEMKDHI